MAEADGEPVPQPVLSPLTRAAIFLVVTIDPGGEDAARDVLSGLDDLVKSVGFRVGDGDLSCVSTGRAFQLCWRCRYFCTMT